MEAGVMTAAMLPFATLATLKTLFPLKIQRARTRYPFKGASVLSVASVVGRLGRFP